MKVLNDLQRNVILALANNDLNIGKTAEELHYHRNSVTYHVGVIKRKTGYDALTFYGLERLLWMLADEEARLELEHCPMCDGEASLKTYYAEGGGCHGTVRCNQCKLSVTTPKCDGKAEAENLARAMWNRRVTKDG